VEACVTHVAIIGAGPAGLAAAAGLARRGVAYTLLERGAEPFAALREIDPEMQLLSPRRLSRLRGLRLASARGYASFRELASALDRYAADHALTVRTGVQVTAVERDRDGFVIRTSASEAIAATHVINATGLAGSPRLPDDFDPARYGPRWAHSLHVRREQITAARELVVVGAGASAAHVLAQWLAAPHENGRAYIAVRSPIRVMRSSLLGIDMHYWLRPFEYLPGRRFGPKLAPRDPMWGKAIVRALARGDLEQIDLVSYGAGEVVLRDGRTLAPDLLVLATGFVHDTHHLGDLVDRDRDGWPIARRCESVRTPGLYVLGARFAHNLASPHLRGIARDAELVARRIARSAA
jgi:cation diffusion facilitator CzcD-associated flavoprotein CzcO